MLTRLEKQLLEGVKPELLEYLIEKFQKSNAATQNMITLLDGEEYAGAAKLTASSLNASVSFFSLLEKMLSETTGESIEKEPVQRANEQNTREPVNTTGNQDPGLPPGVELDPEAQPVAEPPAGSPAAESATVGE